MSTFVTYTYEDHIVNRQNTAELLFMSAFEASAPSLEEAHIVIDPYLINPLSALVLFKTSDALEPTMTIHGKRNERENIVKKFPAGTSHILPVVGLYEGIETKVTITLSNNESKTFFIKAKELPKDINRCLNIMTSMDYFGTDIMILSPAGKNLPIGVDYKGDIRWLLTIPTMFDVKRLRNGNILTGSHRYSRMPYCSVGMFEMTLVGKIVKEYRMPGNYHHDQWEMRDGNLLALSQDYSAGNTTVEDMIELLDRETGKLLRTWDFKDFLPQDQGGSGSQDPHDWFHNNALWVNEDKQEIILSGRHQDAIVCFNYEGNNGKGELKWIIGNPEGWSEDMQKYFFKPVGDVANFDWQYEQHACVWLPDGDVMAFDNGQWRAKSKSNYIKNKDNFSRGVRYRIDTDKMEIEQVWQFGKEWGQDFFSPYICNVEYYADGHYLVHSGGIGSIDGYASDALPAFLDKADPHNEISSKTIEEKDGVLRYYLQVTGNFYRAERLSLYHDGENLPVGAGVILGELDVTPTFDTIPDVEELMEVVPMDIELNIAEEIDKVVLTATFERGSMVMYVLEGSKGDTHGYYINTAAVRFLAMCSGAFLEKKAETQKFNISKLGLSGKYDIKVIINDKKYQTGISIFC